MSGHKKSARRRGEPSPAIGEPEPVRLSLDELLRRRVRELREGRELTREKLAAAMEGLGFTWNADHVAAIERGRAKLTLADILGLAHALRVGWAELVDLPGGLVEFTPSWRANGDQLARVCAMEPGAVHTLTMTDREVSKLDQAVDSIVEQQAAVEVAASLSEKLGRKVSASAVIEAATRLWGRGVIAERDRRADRADASPRQRQAHRAHAARAVLRDLAEAVR